MQTEHIVTLFSLAVIIGGLAYLRRRRRRARTFTQTAAIPAFTDSMPPGRLADAARIAQVAGDAQLILYYQYRGSTGSRREMVKVGLPERRWQSAVRLLRAVHVYGDGDRVPRIAEYNALRKIAKWQRIQTARVGASPTFVSSH